MTGKAILLTSGKGGVGKTTTTANLAAAIAASNSKINVCIIDMDIGLRNLDIQLGLENRIVYNLIDYMEGKCKLKQALVRDKRLPNLYLLPAAQTRDKNAINSEQMTQLILQLKEQFDLVLIDCPAGIEQGFHNSAIATDEAIIITNPEMAAVRDADRVIGILEAYPRKIHCWLVVNRLNKNLIKNYEMMSVNDIIDILGIKLLGIVPEDPNIMLSVSRGDPISLMQKNKLAGQAYRNIAQRLLGNEVPLLDLFNEESNILIRQINKLKQLINFH